MEDKYKLTERPLLFMTSMTGKGEGAGWGFERSLISNWFAFQD